MKSEKLYRVECNYGNKYFHCKKQALVYFQYMSGKQCSGVELWEIYLDKKTPIQKLIKYTQHATWRCI